MGPLGIPELIFIFILALLVFGPKKLPELGRNLGKALTEFRRASNELRFAVEDEVRQLEQQTREIEQQAEDTVARALETGESSIPEPDAPSTPDPEAPVADVSEAVEKSPDGETKPA